jgi:hypothetical protein
MSAVAEEEMQVLEREDAEDEKGRVANADASTAPRRG